MKYAKLPILDVEKGSIWENILYKSKKYKGFTLYKMDITDRYSLEKQFIQEQFNVVSNLAAQAGI